MDLIMDGGWKNLNALNRKKYAFPQQTFWQKCEYKDFSDEVLEGNIENFIGNCKKGDRCYAVAESPSELTPIVLCETKPKNEQLEYLTKEICKQSIKRNCLVTSCYLL